MHLKVTNDGLNVRPPLCQDAKGRIAGCDNEVILTHCVLGAIETVKTGLGLLKGIPVDIHRIILIGSLRRGWKSRQRRRA